jgi:hypothetical protein
VVGKLYIPIGKECIFFNTLSVYFVIIHDVQPV